MTSNNSPLIFLGGTFDPVHFGHLRAAQEILNQLPGADVRLVPCGMPAHRQTPIASKNQRLEMLNLALKNTPKLTIDEREFERSGPSYSFDTLNSYRQEFQTRSISLLMGSDAFTSLMSWYRWNELLSLGNLLVLDRPGYPTPSSGRLYDYAKKHVLNNFDELKNKTHGGILFCQLSMLDISATKIRQQFEKKHSPRFLLPHAILEYMALNNIYS